MTSLCDAVCQRHLTRLLALGTLLMTALLIDFLKPALRAVPGCHSTLVHCSVILDLRPAMPATCCSCFRQCLPAAYPGDCLLSTGCRTDRRRDWQT